LADLGLSKDIASESVRLWRIYQKDPKSIELLPKFEAEAKGRELAGKKSDPSLILGQGKRAPKSTEIVADIVNIAPRYIQDAKTLKQKAPGRPLRI